MNTLQPDDAGLFAEIRQLNASGGCARGKQHCVRGARVLRAKRMCTRRVPNQARHLYAAHRAILASAVPSARSRLLGTNRPWHTALLPFIFDRINYSFKDKGR